MNLLELLPAVLPEAVRWAEAQALEIARRGAPLTRRDLEIARAVGVRHPERIRLLEVEELPAPAKGLLREAALHAGLAGPGMAGVTLGHAVAIRRGWATVRLLSHEFRHVSQYEQAGSISAFLAEYLRQIAEVGYAAAPLEQDARAHERMEDGG